jgi:hypothetical protein
VRSRQFVSHLIEIVVEQPEFALEDVEHVLVVDIVPLLV